MKNYFMTKLKNLILLGLFLSNSCYSMEPKTNDNAFDLLFNSTNSINLKYRPVDTLGPRPTTEKDILEYWLYSVTKRCDNNCGKSARRLQEYLNSGKLSNNECPLPIFAVLEFSSLSGNNIIHINASGHCFYFNGNSYTTRNSFTDFLKGNIITIFSRVGDN